MTPSLIRLPNAPNPKAMPMSTRFFTNQADQTLLRKFRGVFESNADIERFDALVGYPLLDQADQPITAVHPRFLDTPPDIILSESFDHPPQ